MAGVGPEQSDLADSDGLDAPLATKRVNGDQKGKARIGEAGSAKGRQGTGRGRESESSDSGSCDLDKPLVNKEAVATRKGRGKIALVKLGLLRGGLGRGGAGDAVAWVRATCLGMVRGPG